MYSGQEDVRSVIYEACERLGISNSEAYELRFLSLIIDAEKKIGTGNPVGMFSNTYEPKNPKFPNGRKILLPHELISDLCVLDIERNPIESCKYQVRGNYILFNEEQTEPIIIWFKGLVLDFENQPFIALNHKEAVVAYLVYMETTTRYFSKKAPYYQYIDAREWWQDRLGEARGDDFFSSKEQFEEASLELYGLTENIFPCPTDPTTDNTFPYIPDTTPPVITLIGSSTISIMESGDYTEQGARAIDDVDGDITNQIVVSGDTVNVNIPGTYVVKYNVQDSAGNQAVEVIRTIIVVAIEVPQRPTLSVDVVEANADFNWLANGNSSDIKYILEYTLFNNNNPNWDNAIVVVTYETNYNTDLIRDRYLARVKAVNAKNDESLYSVDVLVNTLDLTPPEFDGWDIVTVNDTSVFLSWKEATDNVAVGKYILGWRLASEPISAENTIDLLPTELSKTLELESGLYTFSIQAYDTSGNYSTTYTRNETIEDTIPPTAPVLTVEILSDGNYARCIWTRATDNVGLAPNYEIYAALVSDTDWSNARLNTVSVNNEDIFSDFENLENGQWKFKVEIADTSGNYATSNVVIKDVAADIDPPTVPTNLTGILNGDTISLDWNDSTDVNGVIYEISYTTFDDSNWNNQIILNSTVSEKDIELAFGSYIFRVRAKNNLNIYSDYSNTVTATYLDNSTPKAPTNLLGLIQGNEFKLRWDEVNEYRPFDYKLEHTLESDTDWSSATTETTLNTNLDLFLVNGKYKFRVRIVLKNGTEGNWSNTVILETDDISFELDETTVFYGQCTTDTILNTEFFEQLNSIPELQIYNSEVSLYTTSVTGDRVIEVPYLGSPFSDLQEINKVTHFIAIPKFIRMVNSVNSEFNADVFYDEFNNRYSTLGITINDFPYYLWILSLENPLGNNINVSVEVSDPNPNPIDLIGDGDTNNDDSNDGAGELGGGNELIP